MKPAAIILFALLVIVAGMYLLAKTKKEELGRFFKFISYFIVISGLAIILIVIQMGIIRMAGHCRNNFIHMGMNKGCNKEMPFPPGEHKMMMMMNNDMMDGGNKIVKNIEIIGDGNCDMMKMGGDKGCGMGPNCMMKMGGDKGCGMGPNCMMKMGGDKGCGMGPNCMMKMGGDKGCGMGPGSQLNNLTPEERAMVITKRISDKVSLTTEQFTKVQALILDISNKKDAVMKQTDGDPIKMDGMLKKHEQESVNALKKLLTPAQIKLLPENFPL